VGVPGTKLLTASFVCCLASGLKTARRCCRLYKFPVLEDPDSFEKKFTCTKFAIDTPIHPALAGLQGQTITRCSSCCTCTGDDRWSPGFADSGSATATVERC
ncbi:unnamed protein product, partial [Pylaiella littoralis]